jgi:hypothetical protein
VWEHEHDEPVASAIHSVLSIPVFLGGMNAGQFADYGGPEIIEYGDAPDPEVGRNAVRVDVKAGAGVVRTGFGNAVPDSER